MSISKQRGFTMMELLAGVLILGILFAAAAPSLATWNQNAQIRTTADAFLNGLQLARSEAVKRNMPVRFQLTSSLDNGCALATNTGNWVVSLNDPTSACTTTPADPPPSPVAPDPANPYIVQTRAGTEGSGNSTVAADQSTIAFNGLGRLTPTPVGPIAINISNATAGNCMSDATPGPIRCMRILISTGGQVRMCNPALPSSNAQGC